MSGNSNQSGTGTDDSCRKRVGGALNFPSDHFSRDVNNSFDQQLDKSPHASDDDFSASFVKSCDSLEPASPVKPACSEGTPEVPAQVESEPEAPVHFSATQLSCPAIIEVFCGSARVTA